MYYVKVVLNVTCDESPAGGGVRDLGPDPEHARDVLAQLEVAALHQDLEKEFKLYCFISTFNKNAIPALHWTPATPAGT